MEFQVLRPLLHQWYNQHKRALPWRENNDPYAIWLSEVILQQTRVAQGQPYYERFLEAYPKVELLADAPQEEVLKLWEGLGYYSRARNLQAAAQMVRDNFAAKFPERYEDIRSLKGVGDYTAAAIASFAYNQAHAVVDGNVYRVLSRLTGDKTEINTGRGKKVFQAYADEFLDRDNPALHNQAIMEFGALQCVPKNPACEQCPLKEACVAYKFAIVDELPRKRKKVYDQHRYLNYLHWENKDELIIERRETGIWKGLFQFPLFESDGPMTWEGILQSWDGPHQQELQDFRPQKFALPKHKLSHQSLHISIWYLQVEGPLPQSAFPEAQRRSKAELRDLAFPRPLRKYLDENQLTLPLD